MKKNNSVEYYTHLKNCINILHDWHWYCRFHQMETPTRLRREVESLTANMQALATLSPNDLKQRTTRYKTTFTDWTEEKFIMKYRNAIKVDYSLFSDSEVNLPWPMVVFREWELEQVWDYSTRWKQISCNWPRFILWRTKSQLRRSYACSFNIIFIIFYCIKQYYIIMIMHEFLYTLYICTLINFVIQCTI